MLLHRILLLAGLILCVLIVFWIDRDGLRDQVDGEVSFSDVAYFTAVTITTVGYGDIIPVSDRARIVDTLLVTPLRLVIWLVFLGTAYEMVLQRWLESRRMKRIQNTLSDHLIVCGYGHGGRSCAQEAVARGQRKNQIVVIERDAVALDTAVESGLIGLLGDATREADLIDAGIDRAHAVMVCVGRDDAAVLTVLTIRKLNPRVRIVATVAESENVDLIQHAGADATVAPSILGGFLMADSMDSSHVADYISDLMCSNGRVRLIERPATAAEVGQPMRAIGPGLIVRLHRGRERIGFWEGERAIIQPGDVLLEIEASAAQS